jgi:hypothetical protein
MRFIVLFILLSGLVSGCSRRDAELHKQLLGTWKIFGQPDTMTFDSDGIFHTRFSGVISNTTVAWAQDGSWGVKDGFLILSITNSTASNAPVAVPVGRIDHCKIVVLDSQNLVYQGSDGKGDVSWIR